MSLDAFVALSAALTGVATDFLRPQVDPIGLAASYLATVKANVDSGLLGQIVTVFQSGADPAKGAEAVLADPLLGRIGRSIIKLWLLGAWYSPVNPMQAVNVVSAQSYKESLVWKTMQAHPMGYSMLQFGYWAEAPASLDVYLPPNS